MVPLLAAFIILVTTGMFVWALDGFLNAISSFTSRRDRPSTRSSLQY